MKKNNTTIAETKDGKSNSPASPGMGDDISAENHRKAAQQHLAAAKHHANAAAHYSAGSFKKAAHSAMLAFGHHTVAGEFMSDDAKHHSQVLKQTNYKAK